MDASKCLIFKRRIPLRFEKVDCRRCGQVKADTLVRMSSFLASIVFVNLPTGATRNGDEYDTYARAVMEPFDGETAVLWLNLAINSDVLDGLIWIRLQRSLYHIQTGSPGREYDTS